MDDDTFFDFCPDNQPLLIERNADGTGIISKIAGFDNKLSGENVLVGFEFDLKLLII